MSSHSLHKPVLEKPIVEAVSGLEAIDGYFIDGTLGRGGHTAALLKAYSFLKVIGLDCDHEAIEFVQSSLKEEIQSGRLELHRLNFVHFLEALKDRPLQGALLDLGVSSPQLDQGQRGFSFYKDGPLDMRMDHRQILTAAEIINCWSEEDLFQLFKKYGEVDRPGRVVKRIVEFREKNKMTTTKQLADLIEKAEGWRQKGFHPATPYFMALRIEVNQELTGLEECLPRYIENLVEGGRLFVITFHSLEDRIVKNIFKDYEHRQVGYRLNKNVIVADSAELKMNPRSRSAKLRLFQKGAKVSQRRRDRPGYIKSTF